MIHFLALVLLGCCLFPSTVTSPSLQISPRIQIQSNDSASSLYNITFYVYPASWPNLYNRIIFNGTFYRYGSSGNYTVSNYTAFADLYCNVRLGETCYFFFRWISTGGVSVEAPWHNPTTVTVNGSGSLTEVNRTNQVHAIPPGTILIGASAASIALAILRRRVWMS